MKKYFLSILMMAAMAVVCVTTFTACGGDDDDLPGQDVYGTGTVTYFEPCFDWGSDDAHVKAYMAGWELVESTTDFVRMYTNSQATVAVTYSFSYSKNNLNLVIVSYLFADANYLKKEVERRYNMTLTKDVENSSYDYAIYSGKGVIGGRSVEVTLYDTGAAVDIFFDVDYV